MDLRPYQADTISAIFSHWKTKQNEPSVIVLPTASGKTVIFSALISDVLEQCGKTRILVLSHTRELVEQAATKLTAFNPALSEHVGIFAASLKRKDTDCMIISASRDSIGRHMDKFEPFDLVIIDEAHLVNNKDEGQYRKILNHVLEKNPSAAILGFTATPYRAGANGGYIFGQDRLFKSCCFTVPMIELMKLGFLSKLVAKAPDHFGTIDTTGIKKTAGDFNKGELSIRATDKRLIQNAVCDWMHKAKGRRSSCFFAVSIDHAKAIQAELIAQGVNAGLVTGEMKPDERDQVLADFERGILPAIVNVSVLTVGWDCPPLDCIVSMRPTHSLALWLQIVGRGLRLSPETGKTNCQVLDYGGNLDRFGVIDQARPPSRKKDDQIRVQTCKHCESIVSMFAFNCPDCGGELKKLPRKTCDCCGTECAPSTTKCPACGSIFLTHHDTATSGAILSVDDDIRRHKVERVTASLRKSKKTGREFLIIEFWESLETRYNFPIFIGFPGKIGASASAFWSWLLPSLEKKPTEPREACTLINHCPEYIRMVSTVDVDHRSKYKDVIAVNP